MKTACFDAFVIEAVTDQQLVSSPAVLIVDKETALILNVDKDRCGFNHVFSGCLLDYGEPVVNKQVVIKVNGTALCVVETSSDGTFSVTVNLPAVDGKPTSYQVGAVFYGDDALNLTGLATLPNGTAYAVCTTLQYFGYKPVSNSTTLTVLLQATDTAAQTKTPEEMEQKAKDSGWLSTWHEFTWRPL
jgi:hypothetical protein